MSILDSIRSLEPRIAGLRALIARRESQQGNPQHEGAYTDTSKHIEAAKIELRTVAIDYIALKCANGGGWDAIEVIDRMTAPQPKT